MSKRQSKRPSMASNSGTPADFVGMYDFEQTIGTGQYSVVKRATHVLSKNKVAVKVIDKSKLDKTELEHLQHEVRVMKLMRHPHVIRLYEIVETSNWFYLVLELGSGGDMYEYIAKNGALGETRSKNVFAQLVCALTYCHKHRVAHRDLKPENVVICLDKLNHEQIVKVTDFGLSNSFHDSTMMETFCGSMAYSSPEVLLREPYDGPMSDVWSLGIILYMMVCKDHPFRQANEHETIIRVMDVKYEFPDGVGADFRDLVQMMLQKEPKERATLKQIKDHPWLMDAAGESLVDKWSELDKTAESTAAAETPMPGFATKLTKSEHSWVVSEMEKSNITRAEIDEVLKTETYNYISSTYCLLAEEQLLRRRGMRRLNSTANAEAEVIDSPRSLGNRRSFFSPTDTNLAKSVSMMSPMPGITSPVSATPDRPTGGRSGSLRRTATCPRPGLRQRSRRPTSNIGQLGNDVLYSPMSSDIESLALSPRPPPTIGPLRQQSGSSEDHRTSSGLASDHFSVSSKSAYELSTSAAISINTDTAASSDEEDYAPNFDTFTIRTPSSASDIDQRDFRSVFSPPLVSSPPGGAIDFGENSCVFDPSSPQLIDDEMVLIPDATLTAAAGAVSADMLPDSDATFIAEPSDSEDDPARDDDEEEYLRGAMDGDTARTIVEAVQAQMEEDELSQSARYSDLKSLNELTEESEPEED